MNTLSSAAVIQQLRVSLADCPADNENAAIWLARNFGWHVFAVGSNKRPFPRSHGFQDASNDPVRIAEMFNRHPGANIGVATGKISGFFAVDIDVKEVGWSGLETFETRHGAMPATLTANTPSGGQHRLFNYPPIVTVGCSTDLYGLKIDIRGDGGYIVVAPSTLASGRGYEWANDLAVADAPHQLLNAITNARAKAKPNLTLVHSADRVGVSEGSRNDTLFRFACGLRAQGMGEDEILSAALAENAANYSPPLDDGEVRLAVHSAMRYDPFPETELAIARRLVVRIDGNARYESAAKTWWAWDGRRWDRDHDGVVTRFAKDEVDSMLAEAQQVIDPDIRKRRVATARKFQSAARIAGILELAKTEPDVSIQFDAFDRQLHSLNVANGLVNLRTRELTPHSREAFATRLIDIEYNPDTACPTFDRFFGEILTEDAELMRYVHRAFGYAVTGETNEQCVFFLYGDQANGKSTLLNTVRGVAGAYATHTPTETLIAKTGGASNDLARLAGTRLVTASEANADQRMADALLKQITGDEPIVARYLFKEFFSFKPTFKIFLATNQFPQINGSDAAIWRRIRTIPFNRVFSPDEQDRTLSAKLDAEKEGILAWLIAGAADWYANGLPVPAAVAAANAEVRSDMDSVGQFLEERCEAITGGTVAAKDLYKQYTYHANDNGRSVVGPNLFGRTLTARGFSAEKRGGVQYRHGLAFKKFQLGE